MELSLTPDKQTAPSGAVCSASVEPISQRQRGLFQPGRIAQQGGLVGLLPRELFATEVTVGGGGLVDRALEIQHFDEAVRAQIEELTHQLDEMALVQLAGAEGFHADGSRLGDADGVGDLDFTAIGEASSDDILGDITGSVGG